MNQIRTWHASQQAIVVALLTRVALEETRQVILATRSPEILTRVSGDSLRWLERGNPHAQGGVGTADLLDRLGVARRLRKKLVPRISEPRRSMCGLDHLGSP